MSAWLNEPKLGSTSWGHRGKQRTRKRPPPRAEQLLEARLEAEDGGHDCEACGLPVCACEVRP